MNKFILFFSLFFNFQAYGFVTSCITYDVNNIHPDNLRVDLFVKCMRIGDTIYLDGGVDKHFIDELRLYNKEPISTIFLNSGGENVIDAFELAQFIHENQINTVVRKNALCASACTLLFQAGTHRIAHSTSRFMYHSARPLLIKHSEKEWVKDCLKEPNETCLAYIKKRTQKLKKITHNLFATYEKYGASEELSRKYFNLEKDPHWLEDGNYVGIKDWWVTPEELTTYGVVTELIQSSK